jgi:glycosyltransferase involved in cell wall biosynthesis
VGELRGAGLARRCTVIELLEPKVKHGFVSGGYRYQREVFDRLQARGVGKRTPIATRDLADELQKRAGNGDVLVVDGLLLHRRREALPADTIVLLHTADPRCRQTPPLDAIATGAPTALAEAAHYRRIEVVRPGLDACFVPGPPRAVEPACRIACIGTVSAQKGQLLLLQALARIAAPWQLTLFGDADSDEVAALRAAALAAGRREVVRFAGALPPANLAAELHGHDLVVSASRSESFGMAVAEALACGVPVLAFATGEIDRFVVDGHNGWLVSPTAPPAVFADALRTVVEDHELLARARERSVRPELGDWDAVSVAFEAACRRLRG